MCVFFFFLIFSFFSVVFSCSLSKQLVLGNENENETKLIRKCYWQIPCMSTLAMLFHAVDIYSCVCQNVIIVNIFPFFNFIGNNVSENKNKRKKEQNILLPDKWKVSNTIIKFDYFTVWNRGTLIFCQSFHRAYHKLYTSTPLPNILYPLSRAMYRGCVLKFFFLFYGF